jgi:site-specific recombinase XerD
MNGNPSLTQSPRLLDQVCGKIKHYSIRTEQAYVDWIKRFVLHFDKRHPAEKGAPEVEAFLTHLAVQGKVAASAQNQAKAALLFLYREVLEQNLPWLQNVEQAKAPKRLPVVLTEAKRKRFYRGWRAQHCLPLCRSSLGGRHARSSAGLMS